MVRNNNMIPYGHFHKKWQSRVKLWFDQPMKKVRRRNLRTKKLTKLAPRPVKLLRPMVRCPTVRYNTKVRPGGGFTLQELKQAGINKKYAPTVGIAVDYRRKNRSIESLAQNVERLKKYKQRLILFPCKETLKMDNGKFLNTLEKVAWKVKARKVTPHEKKFDAFCTLRRARCDAKYGGVRMKRRLPKGEILEKI